MEFNLVRSKAIDLSGLSLQNPKKRKVTSICKMKSYVHSLTLNPVIDEDGSTAANPAVDAKLFRENSIQLLFGDRDLAQSLKLRPKFPLTTHLTLNSSDTGKLMIETKRIPSKNTDLDILEALHDLQETLPPNPFEFSLSVKGFKYETEMDSVDSYDDYDEFNVKGLEFTEKGSKLMRNGRGSVRLEMTDIHLPTDMWWDQWQNPSTTFTGRLSLNVKVDVAAAAELYKRNLIGGGGQSSKESEEGGTATDLVILVGGNKEKGIWCHKSILSEMSPVFAAMFQSDMLEKKESTLEIVDFSESVIRALIEFAYRRDLEEVFRSSEVALELLQLAHKYQIKELMDILLYLVVAMSFSWFSGDVAIKLFFFARNNTGEDLAHLEKKGWMILKWYVKENPDKLMESKEIEKLCEDPQSVKELILLLLNKCTCKLMYF